MKQVGINSYLFTRITYIFSSTKFQNKMKDANSKQNSNIQTFDNGFTLVISQAFTMVSPEEGRNFASEI